MSEHATDAMQQFGHSSSARKASEAGFVLLYADGFKALPAAWSLAATGPTRIGSSENVELQLLVPAVSRLHAEVHRDGGGWLLRDMDSTNGTFVDGYRVSKTRLEPGQEVRIGDAILKFVEQGVQDFSKYRLDGSLSRGASRLCQGSSPCLGGYQMDRISERIERLASSPLSILLLGESGTGKEVLARELHRRSLRKGQFVGVNCAALSATLLESELFGYKRGAFSGADRDKPGLIRSADKGTLLLDEIGDMPPAAQVRLLRVLQDREVLPVGATKPEPVDVRVLAATHRDLMKLQEDDRFRSDLYARLNDDQLELPPLRDRKEDIYQLLQVFFLRHAQRSFQVSFPFMMALLHYDWPYNVRELESCAKRCAHLVDGDTMDENLLPDAIRDAMEAYGRPQLAQDDDKGSVPVPTESELATLLQRHKGNIAAVSRELGKAPMQTRRWLARYGMNPSDYRSP